MRFHFLHSGDLAGSKDLFGDFRVTHVMYLTTTGDHYIEIML
ncbi:MAG: hypothetical protein QGI68_03410 [Pseudomonadales bacterium]|nr:hypothetical protein [Pseudomonadales bacterium]MDP7594603.1 hypothetical protein [Pseudomonadales bacterium]HJN52487.1 hypothetical protein [Pseudomonadales bacterium]